MDIPPAFVDLVNGLNEKKVAQLCERVLDKFPHRATMFTADEINALLPALADNKSVFFQDVTKTFLPEDGVLTKEIMPDFLHLSPKGYELWAAAIEPKVKELMKD